MAPDKPLTESRELTTVPEEGVPVSQILSEVSFAPECESTEPPGEEMSTEAETGNEAPTATELETEELESQVQVESQALSEVFSPTQSTSAIVTEHVGSPTLLFIVS